MDGFHPWTIKIKLDTRYYFMLSYIMTDPTCEHTHMEEASIQAVLGPDSMPQPFYRHSPMIHSEKSINHRWFYILALHLAGHTAEEISELVDRHPLTIYAILKRPEVIAVRQQLLAGISDEFEALYSQVVQTIRSCLQSDKETVRLDAAEKWFKAHGKYQPKQDRESELTAEDVVKKILQQQINVQVNVETGGKDGG